MLEPLNDYDYVITVKVPNCPAGIHLIDTNHDWGPDSQGRYISPGPWFQCVNCRSYISRYPYDPRNC